VLSTNADDAGKQQQRRHRDLPGIRGTGFRKKLWLFKVVPALLTGSGRLSIARASQVRVFNIPRSACCLGAILDDLAKNGKTPVLSSFRAQREFSGMIERFLVAALLEMTEIDFLRDH